MANKTYKPEIQALKMGTKVKDEVFTHIFSGTGYFEYNTEDLAHPLLVLDIGEVGSLIYEVIKSHTLDHYFKSYASKYGKNIVPHDCIEYAYYQCTLDDKGRLVYKLNFTKDSINHKYMGKPEVRVIDDFIFKDDTAISPLLPAFHHLYNTRLKDDKWTLLAIDMQYKKNGEKISFDIFKRLFAEINKV